MGDSGHDASGSKPPLHRTKAAVQQSPELPFVRCAAILPVCAKDADNRKVAEIAVNPGWTKHAKAVHF